MPPGISQARSPQPEARRSPSPALSAARDRRPPREGVLWGKQNPRGWRAADPRAVKGPRLASAHPPPDVTPGGPTHVAATTLALAEWTQDRAPWGRAEAPGPRPAADHEPRFLFRGASRRKCCEGDRRGEETAFPVFIEKNKWSEPFKAVLRAGRPCARPGGGWSCRARCRRARPPPQWTAGTPLHSARIQTWEQGRNPPHLTVSPV